MTGNAYSVSSILGINAQPKTNPILELRKLQKQISNAPALSNGDRATQTRMIAERSGVLERSSLFSGLRSEVTTLKRMAEQLSATRLIEEDPYKIDKDKGPSITSSSPSVVSASLTGAVGSTTFQISVGQLATSASIQGNAISSNGSSTQDVEKVHERFQVDRLLDSTGQARSTSVLKLGSDATFQTGDKVKLSGLSESGTFFARVGTDNTVQLFQTADQARNTSSKDGLVSIAANQDLRNASLSKLTTQSQTVETLGTTQTASNVHRNDGQYTIIQTQDQNGFQNGDKVRVNGDLAGDYFVRLTNAGDKQFQLYSSKEGALSGGNTGLIDIGDNKTNLQFQKVTTTTVGTEVAGTSVAVNSLAKDEANPLTRIQTQGNNSFQTGDQVRATGNLPGSQGSTFFVRRVNDNSFELFRTAEQASGNGTDGRVTFETDELNGHVSIARITNEKVKNETSINLNGKISDSNLPGLQLPEGAATLRINGIEIRIGADQTFKDAIKAINQSNAGVTAAFNEKTRQFSLTSKTTGAGQISIQDVSGNLGASLGLIGGTSTAGQDAQFTISRPGQNDQTFTSSSNTIEGSTIGMPGTQLTLKSTSTNPVTITVNANDQKSEITANPEAVKAAIKEFFDQFNKVQSFLESNGEKGGRQFEDLSAGLRRSQSEGFGNSDISNAIGSNSKSNMISFDEKKLSFGIKGGELDAMFNLFRGANGAGFASKTASFLSSYTGSTGSLAREVSRLDQSGTELTKKLDDLSAKEESNRTKLNESLASISSAIVSIQGQQRFLKGLGGPDRETQTREGSTGLNLSRHISQIQDRLKATKAGPQQQAFDLSKGISGIRDFISSLMA